MKKKDPAQRCLFLFGKRNAQFKAISHFSTKTFVGHTLGKFFHDIDMNYEELDQINSLKRKRSQDFNENDTKKRKIC